MNRSHYFSTWAQALNGWGGRIRTSVWRDQNPLPYRLATPQPKTRSIALRLRLPERKRSLVCCQPVQQWRTIAPLNHETLPARRYLLCNRLRLLDIRERREDARARTSQSRRSKSAQPIERCSHL